MAGLFSLADRHVSSSDATQNSMGTHTICMASNKKLVYNALAKENSRTNGAECHLRVL